MVRVQYRCRDGERAPKTVLRIGRIVIDFADHAEIVQRVGEVRMEGAEGCLLQSGSLTQEPFGGGVVARSGRLFRRFDDRARFTRFRHGASKGGTDSAILERRFCGSSLSATKTMTTRAKSRDVVRRPSVAEPTGHHTLAGGRIGCR